MQELIHGIHLLQWSQMGKALRLISNNPKPNGGKRDKPVVTSLFCKMLLYSQYHLWFALSI